ncbi:glycosyltransferase [Actinomadura sp. BRA 177]|uniref:glycosyltransferase n=1 Tax=Actinomadura sp. BRA 177 TaxID=2745202 RepID=UPI00159526C6|nr:glycosyltransferase [Actinomadura sp. BRA 177]NVI88376.1 glycosyltransferase [Actinomadura sp. BRA 177]
MKILVIPRDGNPYQELLYGRLRRHGARVRYAAQLTPSHTLNLLLLPLELTAARLTGTRLVHLHWVFGFVLPGGRRARRAAQCWFALVIAVIRLLGMRLVWTAHNVLPHEPVFADDRAARRRLVRASDLVIAHSLPALDGLAAIGANPRRVAVIPHGPFPAPPLPPPGAHGRFLFLGMIAEYKGVEDLLAAFAALPPHVRATLTVAGACPDPDLAARLRVLAGQAGDRVTLRLERIPDEELAGLYAAADVVALPFRRVTTSGSALLALGHGRPLLIPDDPALGGLPAAAVHRYDGGVPALTSAITELAGAGAAALHAMSAAALDHVRADSWEKIGEATFEELANLRPPRRFLPAPLRGPVQRIATDALYRGSALLLANTVGLAGLGFLFWALAARSYPASAVGWLAGVTAGVNLLATVASLGLPNTMIRHLSAAADPRALARAAVTAVTVIGGTLALACLVLLTPLLPGGGPDLGGDVRSILLVILLVVSTAAGGTLDAGLIATRATGALLAKNLAGGTAKVAALLALTPFGLPGLIVAYGTGTVLATSLGGAVLLRRLPRGPRRRNPFRTLRRHVSFSSGSYLGTVFGILPSTVVPLQVLTLAGSRQTAWFSVAFQLAAFLNFIPSTAAQVTFAEAQRAALRTQLRKAVKAVYALLLPATLLMVLAAPLLLRMFGPEYAESATTCLRLIAAATVLSAGVYLVDAALIARDRTGSYILMNGVNAALVLTCCALALPHGLTAGVLGWIAAQGLSLLFGALLIAVNFGLRSPAR